LWNNLPAGNYWIQSLQALEWLRADFMKNFLQTTIWVAADRFWHKYCLKLCKNLFYKLYTNRNELGNMKIIWSCGQLLEFMQEDSFSKTYAKIYWFELISEKIFLSASKYWSACRKILWKPSCRQLFEWSQTNLT
jgi:hypothetical protein